MFLTYNGIELKVAHVLSYRQTSSDLMVHHRIAIRSVCDSAIVDLCHLQQTLLVPRKALRVNVRTDSGTIVVIDSPMNGYPCDAFNGPKPVSVNIQYDGRKLVIDFEIETWVGL